MNQDITLNPQTFYVLEYLYSLLKPRRFIPKFYLTHKRIYHAIRYGEINSERISIELIRNEFKLLNSIFAELEVSFEVQPLFSGDDIADWYWLTYDCNMEVIPIYDDGVILVKKELILPTKDISNLLKFITVPGTQKGIDVDNHGFGYHFHYGKIRGNRLIRYDLLLTFDPKDTYPPPKEKTIPLYSEKHGGYKHIDISTIGNNKRRPIHNVCEKEMAKKGIIHFKKPSAGASVFYP